MTRGATIPEREITRTHVSEGRSPRSQVGDRHPRYARAILVTVLAPAAVSLTVILSSFLPSNAHSTPLTVVDVSPGQAEATVREILARALSSVLNAKDKAGDDRRFMTPDLYALFRRGARAFDGDPYTGSQEPESFVLQSLSSTNAKDPARIDVTATFAVTGLPDLKPRITYRMHRSDAGWRIDDIQYLADGQSMRRLLKRAIPSRH